MGLLSEGGVGSEVTRGDEGVEVVVDAILCSDDLGGRLERLGRVARDV